MDLLYRLAIRSVIDYALPVYYKTLKQTELSHLEKLQYAAAKVESGALHFTIYINIKLGLETIIERENLLWWNRFQKIHLQETRPLITNCMPKLDIDNHYRIRSKGGYIRFPNCGEHFKLSFFSLTLKMWNSPPYKIQLKKILMISK